jgi:hypothetical protein
MLFPTQALATDPTTGEILPVTPQTGVDIYVTVRQRGWMRVLVDGEVEFEGRVIPGSAYPFVGDETVEVLTGNGAALQIFFNGVDLGPMGTFGQVVNQIYGVEGVITPTPSATLPATATQPVSPTPPVSTAVPGPVEVTAPALP